LAAAAVVPEVNVEVLLALGRRMEAPTEEPRRLNSEIIVTYTIIANSSDAILTVDAVESQGGDAFLLSLNAEIESDPDLLAVVGTVTAIYNFGPEVLSVPDDEEECLFGDIGIECEAQIILLIVIVVVLSIFLCGFCYFRCRHQSAEKESADDIPFMTPCASESKTWEASQDSVGMAKCSSSNAGSPCPRSGSHGKSCTDSSCVNIQHELERATNVDSSVDGLKCLGEAQQKESDVVSFSEFSDKSLKVEYKPTGLLPSMNFPAHESGSDVEFYSVTHNQWIRAKVKVCFIDRSFQYSVYYGRKPMLKENISLQNIRHPFTVQMPCSHYRESTQSWLPAVVEDVAPKSLFPAYTVCVEGHEAPMKTDGLCLRHRFIPGNEAEIFLGERIGWTLAHIVDVRDQSSPDITPGSDYHTDILARFRDGTEIFFPSHLARQPTFTL